MPWSSTSLLGAFHFIIGSFLQLFKATTFPLDICIQLGVGCALGITDLDQEVQLCLFKVNHRGIHCISLGKGTLTPWSTDQIQAVPKA